MSNYDCDIAIVGAGPTGLTIANLLGQQGIKTCLIERNATTVQEPRAVSIDDESLRTMQAVGIVDQVIPNVALDYGSQYFSTSGDRFAKVEPKTREYGYPRRNAFHQPALEAALRDGLDRYASVEAMFGHNCSAFEEDVSGVTLTIELPEGGTQAIRARYLVAADGGRSPIRISLGIEMSGSTYDQRWLIVDLANTKETFRQTRVICDPERASITLPGPKGTRRYEFMLRAGEDEATATDPEFVRNLLKQYGPDCDADVVRRQVYAFHARIADTWRTPRIFLAGDAAHLSPPFAGQGMNSGIRDAHNIAWKLASVIDGTCGPKILDTYEQERRPHAQSLINLAVNMGRVMMPSNRLQAKLTQAAFRAMRLVPRVQNYFVQMKYKPQPIYDQGFLFTDPHPLKGRMIPQPLVEMPDLSVCNLDDLMSGVFSVVLFGINAQTIASEVSSSNEAKIISILPKTYNADQIGDAELTVGRDLDGLLSEHFNENETTAMIVRPDRYIVAAKTVSCGADVQALAQGLDRLIGETWSGENVGS